MTKLKFIANKWVKFMYQNKICIGRTYLHNEDNCEEPLYHFVFLMNNSRETKKINFYECSDLRYLEFVIKPNTIKSLKIKQEELTLSSLLDLIICPTIEKSTIKMLSQNQCNKIHQN